MGGEDGAEEDRIAQTEVHPLSAGRWMDVASIADQDDDTTFSSVKTSEECVCDGAVCAEPARPDDLVDLDFTRATHATRQRTDAILGEESLQITLRWRRWGHLLIRGNTAEDTIRARRLVFGNGERKVDESVIVRYEDGRAVNFRTQRLCERDIAEYELLHTAVGRGRLLLAVWVLIPDSGCLPYLLEFKHLVNLAAPAKLTIDLEPSAPTT